MKKIAVILFIVVPLSSYTLTKNEYYKIINTAYKTNHYTEAIPAIERAITEYPEEPNFYSNLIFFYINTKQFEKALLLAKKAYPKFSGHQYVISAYRSSLLNSGWEEFKKQNYQKALGHFITAYKTFPNDADTINGYGSTLNRLKRYEEAISIFEKGFALEPNHRYIRGNLTWAYMNNAWKFIKDKKNRDAVDMLRKAYATAKNMEENFYSSYVYALINLKLFNEAKPIYKMAVKKFGMTDDFYKAGFWLLNNPIENYKKQKKYILIITNLKALYFHSKQKNLVWKNNETYTGFALMRFGVELANVISDICPYWRKFTQAEKRLAHQIYRQLKLGLPSELNFFSFRFYGDILYRENRIALSMKYLEKAYFTLIKQFPNRYHVQTVIIPCPIKGHQLVMNYKSSIHVTHMGFNRHCFDIIGCNDRGKMYRSNGRTVGDYYGFGVPVYSPVAGKVIISNDGNQDDPINPPTRGDGNWVAIRSADGKIFIFYHLKKNSILVRVGDEVQVGQRIASLGNSSSTVPHLHFGVYSTDWMVTYPVQFTNYKFYKNNRVTFVRAGTPGSHNRMEHIDVE